MNPTEAFNASLRDMFAEVGADIPAGLAEALDTGAPIWGTATLQQDFKVTGFSAPYVVVTRKSDGKVGSLQFTHRPRFYFAFQED